MSPRNRVLMDARISGMATILQKKRGWPRKKALGYVILHLARLVNGGVMGLVNAERKRHRQNSKDYYRLMMNSPVKYQAMLARKRAERAARLAVQCP